MKRVLFLVILNLIFFLNCFAQQERKNWYFGSGTDGIIFDSSNNPVKVSNKYAGIGYEGMITVNDPLTGNLKFYSDGNKVIDKNHNVMTNGTGLTGSYSGAQSVQCCPLPGSCAKKYYLFTSSAYDLTQGTISYSIVDFTSNPLGVVTNLNTPIAGSLTDEGMTLINKPNSNDYWLIASKNTAAYTVYPITSAGIGSPTSYTFSNTGYSYQMNYSKAAQKIVVTGYQNIHTTLIDFNANTGVLSNEVQLGPFPLTGSNCGARFSPDGTKLYVSVNPPSANLEQYDFNTSTWTIMGTCCYAHDLSMGPDGKMYHIHTYYGVQPLGVIDFPNNSAVANACNYHDLTLSSGSFNGEVRRFPEFVTLPAPPIAVQDTVTITGSASVNINVTANDTDLQGDPLIVDSIMYGPFHGTAAISGNQISYTPTAAACGLTDTLIYRIKDDNCAYDTSLVIIKYSNLTAPPVISSTGPVCIGASLNLTANAIPGAVYSWTGPNGYSSSSQNPTINPVSFSDSGTYTLVVTLGTCTSTPVHVTVVVNPVPAPVVNSNSPVCIGSALNLTSSIAGAIYAWTGPSGFTSSLQNPSVNPMTLSRAGTYTLIDTLNGCASIPLNISVTTDSVPQVNLGKDTMLCSTESILLDAGPGSGYNYHWQNGSTGQTLLITTAGSYIVSVTNVCGTASDTLSITQKDCSPELFFPNSFTPNGDNENETWQPAGVNIGTIEVLIYNRWGQLLYKFNSLTKGWDGTYKGQDCPEGVYCYIAKYSDTTQPPGAGMKTREGIITLLR